VTVHLTLR